MDFEVSEKPVRSVKVNTDSITQEISRMMDIEFSGESTFTPPALPNIPNEYNIGLIVGPSGSGKSTILKQFGDEVDFSWDEKKAVVSHFKDAKDAQERLSAVGFNSVPSWLRPYHCLSTGEKFRADLSRRLKSGAVIDEFTSVVDRAVAMSCSYATSRYIRKHDLKNIVFATCHYDVTEWLQPDWIFDTSTGIMTSGRGERRPSVELAVLPCSFGAWQIFGKHHYLDGNINKSARCWIAEWRGVAVGFVAALTMPSAYIKKAWREHRTVILPDYQGMGFGARLSDAVGEIFIAQGCRYFSKTAHPRLGEYRNHSPLWRPTSKNMKARPDYKNNRKTKESGHKWLHANRVCYSHEYVGNE